MNTKLKCAIVDDEPLALGLIESYVLKTPSLILCGKYSNAISALEGLKSNPVDRFIRVHKSFIINKSEIQAIDRGRIVIGQTSIPIGDNYKAEFQKAIGLEIK